MEDDDIIKLQSNRSPCPSGLSLASAAAKAATKRRRSSTAFNSATGDNLRYSEQLIEGTYPIKPLQKHSNRIIERALLLAPLLFSVGWRLFRYPGPLLIWSFGSMYWAPGDIYAWVMPVLYVLTLDDTNRMSVWINLCLSWTSLSGASTTANQLANAILYYVTVIASSPSGLSSSSSSSWTLRYGSKSKASWRSQSGPSILPIDLYSNVTSVLYSLCGQSLNDTEIKLFAQLFCNLVLYEREIPGESSVFSSLKFSDPDTTPGQFTRAVIIAASLSLLACGHYIERIVSISRIIGAHKRPANAEATKLALARKCLIIFSASCIVAFNMFAMTAAPAHLKTYSIFTTSSILELASYLLFGPEKSSSTEVEEASHIKIIGYWGILLSAVALVVFRYTKSWRLDLRRKSWHICVVAMFVPVLMISPASGPFIGLCLAIMLVTFVALEVLRAANVPPYGMTIHNALSPFTDTRDTSGPIIVSHIYLLLGISIPIWATGSNLGLICLGLGDTASSIIGRKYGSRHRIFGDKSIQGTLAFVVAVGLGLYFTSTPVQKSQLHFVSRLLILSLAGALLEATSRVNDNLIVPAYAICISKLI